MVLYDDDIGGGLPLLWRTTRAFGQMAGEYVCWTRFWDKIEWSK